MIVDMQNDFMPSGALPVSQSDRLIKPINQLQNDFTWVLASKDFHPKQHISFKSAQQRGLWPDHCVQGTWGAAFAEGLDLFRLTQVFLKGTHPFEDSYSSFYEGQAKGVSPLSAFLKKNGIEQLVIVGVALDFCVEATALDSAQEGFETTVIVDLCKEIKDKQRVLDRLILQGVNLA